LYFEVTMLLSECGESPKTEPVAQASVCAVIIKLFSSLHTRHPSVTMRGSLVILGLCCASGRTRAFANTLAQQQHGPAARAKALCASAKTEEQQLQQNSPRYTQPCAVTKLTEQEIAALATIKAVSCDIDGTCTGPDLQVSLQASVSA
jgi:hypothetical protein